MPSVKSDPGEDITNGEVKEADVNHYTDFAGVERCPKVRAKTPAPSFSGSARLLRSGLRRAETHLTSFSHEDDQKVLITQDDEAEVDDTASSSKPEIVVIDEDDDFSLGSDSSIQEYSNTRHRTKKKQRHNREDDDEDDISEEDSYDTDLEIDDEEWLHPPEDYDQSGVKTYIRECNRTGVIPVSYFQRHIEDTHFIMKNHGLGPLGAKAIAKPLELNTIVESLDLEGNDIQGEGVIFLCKTIKENLFITDINIAENGIGSVGAEAICNAVKDHTSIKELDVSGNGFRDCDGEHFYNMLSNNASLKRLVLKHNDFEFSGAKWLRDALAENENLRILDLSWNKIRLKGGVFMAEMIKENYGLKYLNLMMNGLGDDGAAAIGAALKYNQCISELNLMANRITENGAVDLAKGLMVNDVLETLRLGKNPISADGAFSLVTAISKNDSSSINLLDLTDIIVKDDFQDLHASINETREFYKLKVIHGGVYYQNKLHYSEVDPLEEFERDPMTKLKRYAEQNKLRLIDIFRQFDKDNSWSVDRDEFILGIKSCGINMSEAEIDKLIAMLDQDGDGQVDYGEFCFADQKNREKKIALLSEEEEKKRHLKEKMERMFSKEKERDKELDLKFRPSKPRPKKVTIKNDSYENIANIIPADIIH